MVHRLHTAPADSGVAAGLHHSQCILEKAFEPFFENSCIFDCILCNV